MKKGLTLTILLSFLFLSCKKDWLNRKPDDSLTVPQTLKEFQALLDNITIMNNSNQLLDEIGSDNYFVRSSVLQTAAEQSVNEYIWAANGWGSTVSTSNWSTPYKAIYHANLVLEGLKKVERNELNKLEWDGVYASALFFRASAYYNLSQTFCKPYDASTSSTDMGVPVRLGTDLTEVVGRGTVEMLYARIFEDIYNAKDLLAETSVFRNRPVRVAAQAMLARIYLSMEKYDSALYYSNAALNVRSTLIDYSTLPVYTALNQFSFPAAYEQNPEILLFIQLGAPFNLMQANGDIDNDLFQSYHSDDLRRAIFYRMTAGRIVWAGNYSGTANGFFSGLTTAELLLTRAECYARANNKDAAMNDLNQLLANRYRKVGGVSTYSPPIVSTSEEALIKILNERRKELVFRGQRWSDLRRLNRDVRFAKVISRIYNSQTYTLTPNDNKYVWPLPEDEILYSGLPQNPR